MKYQYDKLHEKDENIKSVKQNLSKNKDIDVGEHQKEIINKLNIDLNHDKLNRAADPMYPPLQRNPEFLRLEPSRAINIKTRGVDWSVSTS